MATKLRRLSVSIPAELERALDEVKRSEYYNQTQSKMLLDLIKKGLEVREQTTCTKDMTI